MVSAVTRGLELMLEAVGVRPSFGSEEGEKSLFVGWGGIWEMFQSVTLVGFSEDSRLVERGCDGGVAS